MSVGNIPDWLTSYSASSPLCFIKGVCARPLAAPQWNKVAGFQTDFTRENSINVV